MLLHRKLRSTVFPFLVVFALFPLPYYITHAEFRYRLILDPLLVALASLPIERALTSARRSRVPESV